MQIKGDEREDIPPHNNVIECFIAVDGDEQDGQYLLDILLSGAKRPG